MFSDRNATVIQHRSHGERRHGSRHCVVKPWLNESSEGGHKVGGKKCLNAFCKVPSAWQRGMNEGLWKMEIVEMVITK